MQISSPEDFQAWMRQERTDLTLFEFAVASGISPNSIYRLTAGRAEPVLSTLLALVEARGKRLAILDIETEVAA